MLLDGKTLIYNAWWMTVFPGAFTSCRRSSLSISWATDSGTSSTRPSTAESEHNDGHRLDVVDLRIKAFETERGTVTAVDGVSFSVAQGEVVGIVGESGCGKSVTAESILQLLDFFIDSLYRTDELRRRGPFRLRRRGDAPDWAASSVDVIFQDPDECAQPGLHHRRSAHRGDPRA